jgi:ABC-type bacteriocin/lantibiotic exporter with double-glycine peptidase domain
MMLFCIVPVVTMIAVLFGRFIACSEKLKVYKVAESQVIVEETLQGISNVKAFANRWYGQRTKNKITEIVKLPSRWTI